VLQHIVGGVDDLGVECALEAAHDVLHYLANAVLRAAYMHKQCYGMDWAAPGDRIAVLRSDTMEALPEMWMLKSIRPADAETGTKEFELELDHPLPVFEDGVKYGIENLSRTPEVEFRNNIVRNNRARGALFSTPERIVCEDNFFDHPHGSAILLCGDCNGWYETGACHDVLIRNNRFLNCLTARYQFTEAVISVCPEIPELNRQKKNFHSGIRIENNLFETFDEPILFVKSADDVTFRENKIIRNTDFPAFHPNRNAVILKNVRDFRHENNIPELTDRDIRKS